MRSLRNWRIIRNTVSAIEALEEYEKDPSGAKPWEEVKAELVAEGLIDD